MVAWRRGGEEEATASGAGAWGRRSADDGAGLLGTRGGEQISNGGAHAGDGGPVGEGGERVHEFAARALGCNGECGATAQSQEREGRRCGSAGIGERRECNCDVGRVRVRGSLRALAGQEGRECGS